MKTTSAKIFGAVCAAAMLASIARAQTNHYVSPDGGNVSPYTNWATAARNISDAITASAAGAVIWVTNGAYYATANAVAGNGWCGHVYINRSIKLRSVNGRDVTTLDGYYPTYTTRCVRIVAHNVTVDGFTIRNGMMAETGVNGDGGGIQVPQSYTNFAIVNCIIESNRVTGANNYGGGVDVKSPGRGIITNCIIQTNSAYCGGGIYADMYGSVYVDISDCTIRWNRASYGGGVSVSTASKLRGCVIAENTASGAGGGSRCGVFENCAIYGNRAPSGGGLTVGSAMNCHIIGNVAEGAGGGGGVGWYTGGGTLRNCLIAGNQAPSGGGVATSDSCIIDGCTIVRNYATGTSAGGIWVNGQTIRVTNSICYFNDNASDLNPSIKNSYRQSGTLTFDYCCTTNGVPVAGTGNITDDPRFVDRGSGSGPTWTPGNYRLMADSPCFNKGINSSWMDAALDLDGNPRLQHGTVDMGAYELRIPRGTILMFRGQ